MKLLEIITRNVNSILPPTEKRNTICRFYTAWHCKFENCCLFLHPSGPLDISNSSHEHVHQADTPPRDSRNKERKEHRSRCKSRTKHRWQSGSPPRAANNKKVNTKAHVDTRSPEKNHKENTEDLVEAHLQGDTETPKTTPAPNTETWEERTHLETETPPNGQKENTIPHWIWLNQI